MDSFGNAQLPGKRFHLVQQGSSTGKRQVRDAARLGTRHLCERLQKIAVAFAGDELGHHEEQLFLWT